jgi:hypothetical protein
LQNSRVGYDNRVIAFARDDLPFWTVEWSTPSSTQSTTRHRRIHSRTSLHDVCFNELFIFMKQK